MSYKSVLSLTDRLSRWLTLGRLLTVCFLLVAAAVVTVIYTRSTLYLDLASWALAAVDDLVVRTFGLLVLLTAIIGFVRNEVGPYFQASNTESTHDSTPISKYYLRLAKLGAGITLGGAALFASYQLDDMDNFAEGELKKLQQPPPSERLLSYGGKIHARWIQVVGSPQCSLKPGDSPRKAIPAHCPARFLIRAVADKVGKCPTAVLNYQDERIPSRLVSLHPREMNSADAAMKYANFRTTMDSESGKKSAIEVCTGGLPPDTFQLKEIVFPDKQNILLSKEWTHKNGPQRIAVIGDTGCRRNDKDKNNDDPWAKQDCGKSWYFGDVAEQLVGDLPNLVIHLGDYMYSGGEYDNWEGWYKYFFHPAKVALTASPWIMVRGNHETCDSSSPSRDGSLGYDLFFGTGPATLCTGNGLTRDPTFGIDLAAGHRLIVADNVLSYAPAGKEVCSTIQEQDSTSHSTGSIANACSTLAAAAQEVGALSSARSKAIWLAFHVPPFALEWDEKGIHTGGLMVGPKFPKSTVMMREIWRLNNMQFANVDLILAADRHMFQVLKAGNNRPQQIVIGASGVNLDSVGADARLTRSYTPGEPFKTQPPEGWLGRNSDDKAEIHLCRDFGHVLATGRNGQYDIRFEKLRFGCLFGGSSCTESQTNANGSVKADCSMW